MTALLWFGIILLAAVLFAGGFAVGYEVCFRQHATELTAARTALADTQSALVEANERSFANAIACERAEAHCVTLSLDLEAATTSLNLIKRTRSEAGHKAAVTRRANAALVSDGTGTALPPFDATQERDGFVIVDEVAA